MEALKFVAVMTVLYIWTGIACVHCIIHGEFHVFSWIPTYSFHWSASLRLLDRPILVVTVASSNLKTCLSWTPSYRYFLPFSRGEWSLIDDLSCHVIWNFIHWNSPLMLTPGLALNNYVDFHTTLLIVLIDVCMLKMTLFTVLLSVYLVSDQELVRFSPF